jgi:hypothetical protein
MMEICLYVAGWRAEVAEVVLDCEFQMKHWIIVGMENTIHDNRLCSKINASLIISIELQREGEGLNYERN